MQVQERLVMVIEDDPDIRESLCEVLRDLDFETIEASNGQVALDALRDRHPCMILLDLMMPVLDGRAFRAAQLADPSLRDIPVIVISAHSHVSPEEMGDVTFLRKPFDLEQLLVEISKQCAPTAAAGSPQRAALDVE